MGAPQVKGVAIRGILGAIQRRLPPETLEQMQPLLPGEVARAIKHNTFLSGGWYPLKDYRALFDAVMKVTGRDVEVVRELSRDATAQDFRGIYRLFTFVLSPEFLMRRAGTIFDRYYDTGSLTVSVARAGYVEAQYRGCIGFDRVLWEDIIYGGVAVLEACGAKEVRTRRASGGGDGDVDLDMIAEWS